MLGLEYILFGCMDPGNAKQDQAFNRPLIDLMDLTNRKPCELASVRLSSISGDISP